MLRYLEFKEAKCKNCYKCLKNCPVKAIKIEDNQAKIIEDRCILCGKCTLICPQNAKKVHSELDEVKELLKNYKVVASVAPSFISSFECDGFESFEDALKQLGFEYGEETARGAEAVVAEYEKLLSERKFKNFITSCCPAVNDMISLYYPNALKYLAPVDSPAIAHAKLLKQDQPDYKIVFIGPCIAKKKELKKSGLVDGVLTFEDLAELLKEKSVTFKKCDMNKEVSWNQERFFPISRGIIKSFKTLTNGYEYIAVDGVERCKEALAEIDNLENIFIEMNACQSSCINGPCSLNRSSSAIVANSKVRRFVKNNLHTNSEATNFTVDVNISHKYKAQKLNSVKPTEEQIKDILAKTGKFSEDDELNCGACGYPTCREKAWAVANGYADAEMCLPYMRERAESMSYEIIQNSPNGIVVIDKDFNVVDINSKAKELLGVENFKPKIISIFDLINSGGDFALAFEKRKNAYFEKVKIEKTNSFIEISINYIKDNNMFFATMKDITEKVNYDEKLKEFKLETIATTDDVIKKQMRVAQKIASLLGETTAEAKVALVNLKKALNYDKGEE